jgi:hypothetical protein
VAGDPGEGCVQGSGGPRHASYLGIPQDPRMADNVLEVVDVILECLWESYTSGHGPGIMHCSLIIVVSVVLSALAFCFVFALFC